MTREKAKELLDIIKAYSEGKEIEYFVSTKEEWDLITDPIFDDEPSKYRIKTETKYRPFKDAEECFNEMGKHQPFGYIKYKDRNSYFPISFGDNSDFDYLLENRIFADGTPFGIKEE